MPTIPDRPRLNFLPDWVRSIIIQSARKHHVLVYDIMSPTRMAEVVRARNEAIYRIKAARPSLSAPRIGIWFGRDHTTILYAISRHQSETGSPPLYNLRKAAR